MVRVIGPESRSESRMSNRVQSAGWNYRLPSREPQSRRKTDSSRFSIGLALAGGLSHESVRTELPHTVVTLDKNERTSDLHGDAGFSAWEASCD